MADVLARSENLPVREVAAGEALITSGAPGGDVFVLVDGAVEVRANGEALVTITQPGSFIGELSVLLDRPANASVVATAPTTVRVVADAADALRERPDLLLDLARVLARRVSAMTSYLVDLREQYADTDTHLSMMHTVLSALLAADPTPADAGSDREVPPY